mgnify:FL=1
MTSTIKVNNIQNQCGQNIINENSNTITIGASGDTIALASGASQTGFGRTGTVNWQTSIKTGDFTAANGEGYFVDTSSGAVVVTLPSSPSAGNIVAVSDYAENSATNNITIGRNGSNIEGDASNFIVNTNGSSATFVFADSTKGWIIVNSGNSDQAFKNPFVCATGGTITTSGDCRIHTFTGPGTFSVSNISDIDSARNQVSYLVIGGGASGGRFAGGGGGAGGYREDKSPLTPYTASPLEGAGAITVTATNFPIVVGGGGAAVTGCANGTAGSASTFSTITSAGGGGGGGTYNTGGTAGASGGGGSGGPTGAPGGSGAAGNTPPVSPPQGQNGGNGHGPTAQHEAGGGGGAGAVGVNASGGAAGAGGAGVTSSINASPVQRAGGGGGAVQCGTTGGAGAGGGGAGGRPPCSTAAGAGTANTGGGGGGAAFGPRASGAGGSGIVIIRYKFQ